MLFTVGHSNLSKEAFIKLLLGIDKLVDVRSLAGSRANPQFNKENMKLWLPESGIIYEWNGALGGLRGKAEFGSKNGIRTFLSEFRLDEALLEKQLTEGCTCWKTKSNNLEALDELYLYFVRLSEKAHNTDAQLTLNLDGIRHPKGKLGDRMKTIFKKIPKTRFEEKCEVCHKAKIVPNWFHQSFFNYEKYMETKEFQIAANKLLEESKTENVAICCCESLYYKCHRSMVSDYALAKGIDSIHLFSNGLRKHHSEVVRDRLARYSSSTKAAWRVI